MMQLINYFEQGQKFSQTHDIGLEVEHFIIDQKTGQPMPYSKISQVLYEISDQFDTSYYEQGQLMGLENTWILITLEPGCQLEISLACMSDLDQIFSIYHACIMQIRQIIEPMGYEIVYSGGLPTVSSRQVQRIDKKRYQYMEAWFQQVGTRGLEMMKATAAVHVSVDYSDEKDFVLKYRLANILHPIFAFLTSNTKQYAGQQNEDLLLRDSIWHHTDDARCGVIPSLFEEDFGFMHYAKWLLDLPLIVMHDHDEFIDAKDLNVRQAMEIYGQQPEKISHYLSMSFLDIRLKRFIEIRSADSMPEWYAKSYCALIKGIFYQPKMVQKYQSLCDSIEKIEEAKTSLRKADWQARVYDISIMDLCTSLFEDAKNGLSIQEQEMLKPLQALMEHQSHIYKEVQ